MEGFCVRDAQQVVIPLVFHMSQSWFSAFYLFRLCIDLSCHFLSAAESWILEELKRACRCKYVCEVVVHFLSIVGIIITKSSFLDWTALFPVSCCCSVVFV